MDEEIVEVQDIDRCPVSPLLECWSLNTTDLDVMVRDVEWQRLAAPSYSPRLVRFMVVGWAHRHRLLLLLRTMKRQALAGCIVRAFTIYPAPVCIASILSPTGQALWSCVAGGVRSPRLSRIWSLELGCEGCERSPCTTPTPRRTTKTNEAVLFLDEAVQARLAELGRCLNVELVTVQGVERWIDITEQYVG